MELMSVHAEGTTKTSPNLICTANQDGLLRNTWQQWSTYRDARNLTGHSYDEAKAREITKILPDFLKEAEYLSTELKKD